MCMLSKWTSKISTCLQSPLLVAFVVFNPSAKERLVYFRKTLKFNICKGIVEIFFKDFPHETCPIYDG